MAANIPTDVRPKWIATVLAHILPADPLALYWWVEPDPPAQGPRHAKVLALMPRWLCLLQLTIEGVGLAYTTSMISLALSRVRAVQHDRTLNDRNDLTLRKSRVEIRLDVDVGEPWGKTLTLPLTTDDYEGRREEAYVRASQFAEAILGEQAAGP